MLSLTTLVSAKSIPGPYKNTTADYQLYGDTEKSNTYYVLPEMPTFNPMSDGNPSFNLIWFFGGGVTPGGVCTFTVALPLPNLNATGVRDALTRAVNEGPTEHARTLFALAQAYAKKDTPTIEQLLKQLEIKDDQGRQITAKFNPALDYTQFMPPAKANLEFKPILLKSGSVRVRAFGPGNYETWQKTGDPNKVDFDGEFQTTPSLVLNNAAVVNFSLNERGTNLFWHALGGPPGAGIAGYDTSFANSVVAVQYTVEFDGMLPQAEAIVTLKKDTVATVLTKTRTSNSGWGRPRNWEDPVGKDLKQTVLDSTVIRLPSSAYTQAPAGKKSIKETLVDWAATQMSEMLQAQLPDIKLADLRADGPDQLKQVQDQTRTYSLAEAMPITRYPQGQLPKINGLISSPDKLGQFFTPVNLADRPYFEQPVILNPPTKKTMTDNQIRSVVITRLVFGKDRVRRTVANNATEEVSDVSFANTPAASEEQVRLSGTFARSSQKELVGYDYAVAYADGTPTYQVTDKTLGSGQYYLNVDAADLGVLRATLDGTWLPWGILASVIVDVKYGDLYEDRFQLTAANPKKYIGKPLGRPITEKLQYRVTLNFTSGKPLASPADGTFVQVTPNSAGSVQLKNTLDGVSLTNATFELGSGISSASSRLEYPLALPDGTRRVFSKLLRLDGSKTASDTWIVPQKDDGTATFTFKQLRVSNGMGQKPLPDQTTSTEVTDPLFTFLIDKVDME